MVVSNQGMNVEFFCEWMNVTSVVFEDLVDLKGAI